MCGGFEADTPDTKPKLCFRSCIIAQHHTTTTISNATTSITIPSPLSVAVGTRHSSGSRENRFSGGCVQVDEMGHPYMEIRLIPAYDQRVK